MLSMGVILLVEQDAAERDSFVRAVAAEHRAIAVQTLADAWASLVDADLLVVGLDQSDDASLTILDRVHAVRPGLPVVITAPTTLHGWQLLRSGMRLGARDFLSKPFDHAEVRQTIRSALEQHAQARPDSLVT
jgi:two-component system response regulator QseB